MTKINLHMPEKTVSHYRQIRTLNDIAVGQPVRIKELRGEETVCQRLREMGFCEFAEICKVAHHNGLICRVCDGKVALSKDLADNIVVETVDPPCPNK